MTRPLRYGSVCSGIEAATAAWHPLGWEPAWFAEIDPFCSTVLAHHYPDVPNHGDFTRLLDPAHPVHGEAPIDVLVGGPPCQDFSIAGLRAGLGGDRGGLTMDYVRLVDTLRPRWILYENVPGLLSADGGRALGSFLGALGDLGYGWAYRVLDAQGFGLAQRRKRLFVVGHAGGRAGRAGAVLLEPESVPGDPPARGGARQVPPAAAGVRAAKPGGNGVTTSIAFTTRGREDGLSVEGMDELHYALKNPGAGRRANDRMIAQVTQSEVAGPLDAHYYKGPGSRAGGEREYVGIVNVEHGLVAHGTLEMRAVSDSITTSEYKGHSVVVEAIRGDALLAFDYKQSGADAMAECSQTLRATPHATSWANRGGHVAAYFPIDLRNALRKDGSTSLGTPGTGFGADGDPSGAVTRDPLHHVATRGLVRRLTPRECERLQGFPDDFTLVPYRGKMATDSNRYRALGNSMAVPCIRWIGERLARVDAIPGEDEP